MTERAALQITHSTVDMEGLANEGLGEGAELTSVFKIICLEGFVAGE